MEVVFSQETTPGPGTIEVMPWQAPFATGFADIDAQHRQLVAEINQLALRLAATDPEVDPLPPDCLARLLDYAAVHFATEERLWARWLGADPRVEDHRRRHGRFIETIGKLRDRVGQVPAVDGAAELLGFLTRWLARHILREDHDLARRVRARQGSQGLTTAAGSDAAEAPQAALVENLLAMSELLVTRGFRLLRETQRRRDQEEALRRTQEQERSLRRQRDIRQLINELAADFMAASSGEFDPAVDRILQRSGEHFAADRAYVFLCDPERRTISNTHEWCAPGITPQKDLLQGVSMDEVTWWWEQIARVGHVLIPDVAQLPAAATAERAILEPQGIQSLCAFPLSQAGQLSGLVGFDAVLARRDWGEAGILDFGNSVSDLISIALARSQMQQSLVAAREAEARHASELHLGVLVDQGLAGVAEVDLNGCLTRVNDRYCQIVGLAREALLGRHLREFTFALDWAREEALFARVLAGEQVGIVEKRYRGPGDCQVCAQIAVGLMRDPAGEPRGFLTLVTETTELKQAQERLRAITDAAHDAILMMDPHGTVTYWNPAAAQILGYPAEEALGQDLHRLLAPARFHAAHQEAFANFQRSGRGAAIDKTVELAARRKDGREIIIELSLAAIELRDGWHSVGILRDVTPRKAAEEDLRRSEQRYRELAAELDQRVRERTAELTQANAELAQANAELARLAATDGLTGVANRRHFQATLAVETARARRYGSQLALVMFDVDHFKAVNDRHGHHVGDRVLVEVVRQIRDHLRASDHLARWGGEEFMILLTDCDQGTAMNLAERFRLLIIATPLDGIGPVTASFGVATYVPAETDEDWLRRVDGALYAAKAAGRNRVCLGDRHVP